MAQPKIKDTGERMVPETAEGSLEYGEHIVRYEAALSLVKNKTVLDIASGSGYGTAMLGKVAKFVQGVDYDKDAVAYAQATYGRKNTSYVQGDATNIPLADDSVDVVVSFETLEHINDYRKFMSEIKRVMKPDGLLILSTPNDKEFPEGAHFHIHEFKQEELEKLVAKYFKNTAAYFQVTWKYNALLDEKTLARNGKVNVPTLNAAPVGLDKALYFYMLCSNRKITETIEPVGAFSEHWSTRGMLEHNASMDRYIKDVIKHYEKIIKAKDVQLEQLVTEPKRPGVISDSRRAGRWAKRRFSNLKTKA